MDKDKKERDKKDLDIFKNILQIGILSEAYKNILKQKKNVRIINSRKEKKDAK